MTALDPTDIASRRHPFAPEAGGIGSEINRQPLRFENLTAIHAGEWHFGGWNKPEVILSIVVHRIGVLREMSSAGGSLRRNHQRRSNFKVGLLPRFQIEHKGDQRPLQLCAEPCQ